MFDYIRLVLQFDNILNLLNNKKLKLIKTSNAKTNDVLSYYAELENLKITINVKNKTLEIKGSLHHFYHGNNSGNFTYLDLVRCIVKLSIDLNIRLEKATIKRIEFGLNMKLSRDPLYFSNRLIAYKRERFCKMRNKNGVIIGSNCIMDRWYIKVYSKTAQSNIEDLILRYEIVVTKMEQLQKTWSIPIFCLKDLLEPTNWQMLFKILVDIWNKIIVDEIDSQKQMNKNERILYLQHCNPDSLYKSKSMLHRNTFMRRMIKFKSLQVKHGNNWHSSIKKHYNQSFQNNVQTKLGANAQLHFLDSISNNGANVQLDSLVHLH